MTIDEPVRESIIDQQEADHFHYVRCRNCIAVVKNNNNIYLAWLNSVTLSYPISARVSE